MELVTELLGDGLIPALVGALFGFLGRGFDRTHGRELGRLDRSFDIKFSRYTEYLGEVEKLLRFAYELDYRGIDPGEEWQVVDELPRDLVKAQRGLLVFAPEDIRRAIDDQLQLIAPAMEFLRDKIPPLQKSQDELIELMKKDLDLSSKRKRWWSQR